MSVKPIFALDKSPNSDKISNFSVYQYQNPRIQHKKLNNDLINNEQKIHKISKSNNKCEHTFNSSGDKLLSKSSKHHKHWYKKLHLFQSRFMNDLKTQYKQEHFHSKFHSNKKTMTTAGMTVYPNKRSITKSVNRHMFQVPKSMHKRELPLQSLDIKIPIDPRMLTTPPKQEKNFRVSISKQFILCLDKTIQKHDSIDKENEFPDLNANLMSNSGTTESVERDKSMQSLHQPIMTSTSSPYKSQLKRHISNYINSKNEIKRNYLSSKGNRNKKFVFAKLEKIRLFSESELRKILFKEIKENKKYIETLNSNYQSSRLFNHPSMTNYNSGDGFKTKQFKEASTVIEAQDITSESIEPLQSANISLATQHPKTQIKLKISMNDFEDMQKFKLKLSKSKRRSHYNMPVHKSYFLRKTINPTEKITNNETTIEAVYPNYHKQSIIQSNSMTNTKLNLSLPSFTEEGQQSKR